MEFYQELYLVASGEELTQYNLQFTSDKKRLSIVIPIIIIYQKSTLEQF